MTLFNNSIATMIFVVSPNEPIATALSFNCRTCLLQLSLFVFELQPKSNRHEIIMSKYLTSFLQPSFFSVWQFCDQSVSIFVRRRKIDRTNIVIKE